MKANTFTDRVINGFKKAASELEELQVQLTLGKYEARDLFETIKKDLNAGLHDVKLELNELGHKEEVQKVLRGIDHLRVQLALGIAETEDVFEAQKKKVMQAMAELEASVKGDPSFRNAYADIHFQVEKFRMKLELLKLHYKLNKLKAEYNWEERKESFNKKLDSLREQMLEKEKQVHENLNYFGEEMAKAAAHFRKAFQFDTKEK